MDNEKSSVDLPQLLLLREEIQDESFLDFLRLQKVDVEYPKI